VDVTRPVLLTGLVLSVFMGIRRDAPAMYPPHLFSGSRRRRAANSADKNQGQVFPEDLALLFSQPGLEALQFAEVYQPIGQGDQTRQQGQTRGPHFRIVGHHQDGVKEGGDVRLDLLQQSQQGFQVAFGR